MKKIDAHNLYRLGQMLSKLSSIEYWDFAGEATTLSAAGDIYLRCHHELSSFLLLNPFNLKMTHKSGSALLKAIDTALQVCRAEEDKEKKIGYEAAGPVTAKLREFETLLRAEIADLNVYLVEQKKAFDTATIVFWGENAFPSELSVLGDAAIQDARSAMRCIAFELPTAAAFHLHRLNETVLGAYWDAVTGMPRPKNQALGAYIGEIKKMPNHDPFVVSTLDQIRDLHRNPTMHADYTLSTTEEAIALFGIVSSVISYMLASIPQKKVEQNALSEIVAAMLPSRA